jgi:hypothetical protein
VIQKENEKGKKEFSVVSRPVICGSHISWQLEFDGFTSKTSAVDYAQEFDKAVATRKTDNGENKHMSVFYAALVQDLKSAIVENYDGYRLESAKAVDELIDAESDYTLKDVETVIAVKIQSNRFDGRISAENKSWSQSFIERENVDFDRINNTIRYTHIDLTLINRLANEVQKRDGGKAVERVEIERSENSGRTR